MPPKKKPVQEEAVAAAAKATPKKKKAAPAAAAVRAAVQEEAAATAAPAPAWVGKAGKAPPGTIAMDTGVPQAPLDWRAKDAARLAATGATNKARLAGTVTVAVRTTARELEALAAAKVVGPVQRVVGRKGDPERARAVVAWEEATGEFSTPKGQVPLSRLREALTAQRAVLAESGGGGDGVGADAKLLEHLWALQCPMSSPWKRPLCRLFTTALTPPPGPAAAVATEKGTPKGKEGGKAQEVEVELTFYVYFGRLIFELIADPDIQGACRLPVVVCWYWLYYGPACFAQSVDRPVVAHTHTHTHVSTSTHAGVMSRLKPCGPVIPTTPLPPTTPMFNRSPLPASATAAVTEIEIDDDDDDDSVVVISSSNGLLGNGTAGASNGKKRKAPAPATTKKEKEKGKGTGAIMAEAGENGGGEDAALSLKDAEAYEFEVGGLLRAAESEGYAVRDPQPPGLRVSLFEFQRSTLQVGWGLGWVGVGWGLVDLT